MLVLHMRFIVMLPKSGRMFVPICQNELVLCMLLSLSLLAVCLVLCSQHVPHQLLQKLLKQYASISACSYSSTACKSNMLGLLYAAPTNGY